MKLTDELLSQFAKVTKDDKTDKKETIVYGTVVVQNGTKYVRLDGSDLLTPISATADSIDGERVIVMIKNHEATITGNITSPAARVKDVQTVVDRIGDVDDVEEQLDILIDLILDLDEDINNVRITASRLADISGEHTQSIQSLGNTIGTLNTEITSLKTAVTNSKIFTDTATGKKYTLVVTDGELKLKAN